MKLYKKKYRKMEKTAGTNMPKDPHMWSSEVLKALVSEHPYSPRQEIKIVFDRIEPESKETTGKIIIKNKCAAPFTIRPKDKTDRLELDPIDILFDGDNFKHFNEESLRGCLNEGAVAEVHDEDSYGTLPPSNRYIGGETGDVTPLEHSSSPASMSGSRMRTASCGTLSKVVKDKSDLNYLDNMLTTYSGVNSIVQSLGLSDSLDMLSTGMTNGITDQRLAHVMKRPDGSFAVEFPNGDTRVCSARDLRGALGSSFDNVMRHVMQRGWCMVRDFATLKSVEQPLVDNSPSVIKRSGRHRLVGLDGDAKYGYVFSQMVDFDGQRIDKQKVVLDDGSHTDGKAVVGVRLQGDHETFPIGIMDTGKTGFFIDESFVPSATPNFEIKRIICMPNQPDIVLGVREGLKEPIGLVMVSGLNKPQKISPGHYDGEIMPENSYYIPDHMSFAEVDGKCKVMDKAAIKKEADSRPKATLEKNANRYTIYGKTEHGDIDDQFMEEEDMRMKLAWHGADDYVIEKACDMDNGESQDLWGLAHPVKLKEASQKNIEVDNATYKRIKLAAEQAMEGIDETGQTQNPVEDPSVMDSILSLQFINDETLEEIIESQDVFEEAEDKLAQLLLAARQGEDSIHEKGVKKALKGLGDARKSLKTLQIELKDREQ